MSGMSGMSGNGWPSRSSLRTQACFRLMCETKGCLQARQGGVKSNFIGSNHAVG